VNLNRLNQHRLGWNFGLVGWHEADVINNIHAVNNPAENGIAPVAGIGFTLEVKWSVYLNIDEKL